MPRNRLDPRYAAFRCLVQVETSRVGSQEALANALGAAPRSDPRDRALATELAYGTLRWRRRLDHALAGLASRGLPVDDTPLMTALRLGAYQLLFLPRVAPWAAVDGSVRLIRRHRGGRAKGFVNGILRALARRDDAPPLPTGDTVDALAVCHSLPSWLVTRLAAGLAPDALGRRLAAENRPAPLFVRANRAKLDAAALAERLRAEGAEVRAVDGLPDALRVERPGRIFLGPALRQGLWLPQDAASQRIVSLLEPRPGERVLDLCAGAGVKATQIAELVGARGRVDAVDLSATKVRQLLELRDRWGTPWIEARATDSTALPSSGPRYDRVLVDAPCTALGLLRRRPEIRWRRTEADVAERAALQRRLLAAAAERVVEGGRLVYAVCTFTEEEGPAQIRRFLAERPDFRLLRLPPAHPAARFLDDPGLFRTDPTQDEHDTFFAAVLERSGTRPATVPSEPARD